MSPRGDDTNSGAQVAPVRTIQRGIEVAAAAGGGTVRVAGGSYDQALTLRSNVRLDGGYNPDSWVQDTANFTTEIRGGRRPVRGTDITNAGLRNLSIVAADASGNGSSVGVTLVRATGIEITLNRIRAGGGSGGRGGNGGDGGSGSGGPSIGIAFATGSSFSGNNTITLGQGGAGGFRSGSAASTSGQTGRTAQTLEIPGR